MDFQLFHALNGLLNGHDAPQDVIEFLNAVSVPLFAVATALLWLLDRPGSGVRFRSATLLALGSGALALAADQVISHLWVRERPFVAHPGDTLLLVARSGDPSFPSDHAAAAFAIAVAVFLASRRLGWAFLAAAAVVAIARVMAGVHYPADVAAGALIGAGAAILVTSLLGRVAERAAARLGRITDPVVGRLWRGLDAIARRPGSTAS